jgi:predicted MPP superfamily phosphohydrolase
VLAGLRAPHGVVGCLGNHEQEGEIEDSITRLFAAQGIRILRQERTAIRLNNETLNLIGIDEARGEDWESDVYRRLQQVKQLVIPDSVNILLVHYPAVFDYVTELGVGVDLTLAGHTHGGQLSLDWIHRDLNLGLVVTQYTSGWYEKSGAQLYVNRGIGTTGFPIRLGARPEITVLELVRGV